MTLTSDFPPSIVAARVLSLPLNDGGDSGGANGLQFIPEPGYNLAGNVGDLETLTISGQDFGTKAPPRHFDRIDRYWANGTEHVSPYGAISDGDALKVGSGYPFLGTQGTSMASWRFRSEAARHGRTLGYQTESDALGRMEGNGTGYTADGFAGWPETQRDSEEVYIRYWRYQKYFGTDGSVDPDMGLAATLSAGATSATINVSNPNINSGTQGPQEFYIELDDGSYHYCIQQEPLISETEFTFSPQPPSQASAENRVYRRKNAVNKNVRMRDADEGSGAGYNVYSFSGFQGQISNDKWSLVPGKPQARWEFGEWELHEYYIRAPKLEADLSTNLIKRARINGVVRMDLVGSANIPIGNGIFAPKDGWPSSGLSVTLFGFEEDRPHVIPGNKYRVSDVYVDNSRRRVEIGIGSDDLYQCAKRECCPISSWNTSIQVKLNALPFTEAELAQARIFVVDENDAATRVGRIQ